MADRKRSQDGTAETEQDVNGAPQSNAVPGAHGGADDSDRRATGVSKVRSQPSEIAPSEDVSDD